MVACRGAGAAAESLVAAAVCRAGAVAFPVPPVRRSAVRRRSVVLGAPALVQPVRPRVLEGALLAERGRPFSRARVPAGERASGRGPELVPGPGLGLVRGLEHCRELVREPAPALVPGPGLQRVWEPELGPVLPLVPEPRCQAWAAGRLDRVRECRIAWRSDRRLWKNDAAV